MLLEDLLGRQGQRPARVLYGFIDHGLRNVAAPLWLWSLSFNERTVETPYALLTPDGRLERHPPEGYPSLPLHRQLALVALIENFLLKRRAGRRRAMAVSVTKLLIAEMAERCRAAGVEFWLVFLSTPKTVKRTYAEYAAAHHIDVIDCDHEYGPEGIVPGEHTRTGRFIGAGETASQPRSPSRSACRGARPTGHSGRSVFTMQPSARLIIVTGRRRPDRTHAGRLRSISVRRGPADVGTATR